MEIDEVLQDLALSDELFDDLNRDKNNCVNDECLVVQDCVINTSQHYSKLCNGDQKGFTLR